MAEVRDGMTKRDLERRAVGTIVTGMLMKKDVTTVMNSDLRGEAIIDIRRAEE
jgi:hypothetical protein